MTNGRIRVFLVEDSLVCLTILKQMLATSPAVEVVGTAKDGKEALDLIPSAAPDVICTDLEMPVMDGLELTKTLMKIYPRAILVVSNYVQKEDTRTIFQVLEAGAIDVFPKPRGGKTEDFLLKAQELIAKIKILAGVVVFRRQEDAMSLPSLSLSQPTSPSRSSRRFSLVVMGASTGGPQAFQVILTRLPADFPVPVICIQHISEGFLQGMVDWLSTQCAMKVKTATVGTVPQPGVIYFPIEGMHLELDVKGALSSSTVEAVEGHRPSVDVTFQSIAKHWYGKSAIGVLLTGMGRDGVAGLKTLREAGSLTIAQDEQSSVVFGMPRQAIELGAAAQVLPLQKIAPTIVSAVSR
ncbi:MAG: chemotaxis-specific protein-glutamate methyltransferase CheB [Nitrospirales bacterium]|nr:chemotaxis-specific protein-glutamate methyltransferase CheB [Nitrospirales bacterium]